MGDEGRIESHLAAVDGNIDNPVEIQDTAPVATQMLADNVPNSTYSLGHQGNRALDMAGIADSLPAYGHAGPQQSYMQQIQPITNPHVPYHLSGNHYGGSSQNFPAPVSNQFLMHYQGQRLYGSYHAGSSSEQHLYSNQMHLPNQVMVADGIQPYFQHLPSGSIFPPSQFGHHARGLPTQLHYGYSSGSSGQMRPFGDARDVQQTDLAPQTPNTLRGPPRKPKQSGHALWVGNLPPGANIVDLKDHFSRDATNDIESIFLISKSNCAFVNYKNDQSCTAAMSRFHDSRFQSVRLACRLRRGSSSGIQSSTIITSIQSPADDSPIRSATDPQSVSIAQATENLATESEKASKEVDEIQEQNHSKTQPKVKERFFVIKSLTLEDLERSVQSGVWATQSHNETTLNQAYALAESVYLVFSVNKSGEYFGYARMESTIDDESAAAIADQIPDKDSRSTVETRIRLPASLPITILTPATATAPKGRIIDDSARGTIFWEAEYEDAMNKGDEMAPLESEDTSTIEEATQSPSLASINQTSSPSPSQTTYGKPFRIAWQSTERLPFYRTRGLRNPWNTNREVKIARDGTEIEPSVGRRLVDMFGTQAAPQNRPQPGYADGLMTAGSRTPPHPQGSVFGSGY